MFYSGLVLSAGLLMKHNGLVFILFAEIYLVYDSVKYHIKQWSVLLKRTLYFLSGIFVVVVFSLLAIYYVGIFEEFWFWNVVYPKIYVSYAIGFDQAFTLFLNSSKLIVKTAPLLWILVCLGVFSVLIKNKSVHLRFFLILFSLFSFLAICPGFYFRKHYFILLIPCASVLSCAGLDCIKKRLPF